jgi:hypothetical protein
MAHDDPLQAFGLANSEPSRRRQLGQAFGA